jgi:hypothetical protein
MVVSSFQCILVPLIDHRLSPIVGFVMLLATAWIPAR